MRKLVAFFVICVLVFSQLPAAPVIASNGEHIEHDNHQEQRRAEAAVTTEQPITGITIKYPAHANDPHLDHAVQVRFQSLATDKWGEWVIAEPSYDGPENFVPEQPEALVLTAPASAYQLAIEAESGLHYSDLEINTISAQSSYKPIQTVGRILQASVGITDVEATMIPRWSWGANEALRYDFNPGSGSSGDSEKDNDIDERIARVVEYDDGEKLFWPYEYRRQTKGIVVHHTVTANTDEITDFRPVVNAIYNYHTLTRGWGDVGYNFLIDPNGAVYEGRAGGTDVSGAHASGFNYETVGIALIGNFETDAPSAAQLQALFRTIISLSGKYNLDLDGTYQYSNGGTYNVISGHRDVGRTACPGRLMYAILPAVRTITANVTDPGKKNQMLRDLEPLHPMIELGKDDTATATFTIENISNQTWNKLHFTFPDYQKYEQDQLEINARRDLIVARPKSGDLPIAPGEQVTLEIALKGGYYNGFVPLLLTPVINDTAYTTDQVLIPVFVDADFRAGVEGKSSYSFNEKSSTKEIEVTFVNNGNFAWNSDIYLGVFNPLDRPSRFASEPLSSERLWRLDSEVEPGEEVTIRVPITIPELRTKYSEEWRLVVNGYQWADGTGLTINYTPPTLTGQSTTTTSTTGLTALQRNRLSTAKRITDGSIRATQPTSGVDSEAIRVHLSYVDLNTMTLTLNSSYVLYIDGQRQRLVHPSDDIRITQASNKVEVQLNKVNRSGSVVRLEPVDPAVGIFALDQYEQRPAWNPELNDNSFRGTAEFRIDDEDGLIVINELSMYHYLRGIAEVSNGSHPEMIKTLMILSRTYAAMHRQVYNTVQAGGDTSGLQFTSPKYPGKPYSANDDPNSFQKYRGYGFEQRSPNATQYLDEVINKVVTHNGKLVITPYFSCSNGQTLSGEEKWGWDFTPYLVSVEDPGGGDGKAAGHGVGLSGCGGRVLAEDRGYTFDQIISYFYQGIQIASL